VAVGGRIEWNENAFRELFESPTGPLARLLLSGAEKVAQEAKRLAPVSPHGSHGRQSGYLRSQIGFELGSDARGLYADISSPALSVDGDPYGLFIEVGTSKMKAQPHLRPALFILKGSL
jgi:hypothetical protein